MSSTFQDVMDNIALLVGGTGPDLVNNPGWYSGFEKADGTGIAGIQGCYSRPPSEPPSNAGDNPVGLILPGPFTIRRGVPEPNIQHPRLQFVMHNDISNWPALNPLCDLVPGIFAAHMTVQPTGFTALTPPILECYCSGGQPFVQKWGDTEVIGWEFTLYLDRTFIRTYTA